MGPLVRRSWQPQGQTPVLVQRGRSLEKVSALAALGVSPRRDRVRLYFRLHPRADIGALIPTRYIPPRCPRAKSRPRADPRVAPNEGHFWDSKAK